MQNEAMKRHQDQKDNNRECKIGKIEIHGQMQQEVIISARFGKIEIHHGCMKKFSQPELFSIKHKVGRLVCISISLTEAPFPVTST